jgi:peptide/nickel transport system substrate-binding protein
MTGGYRTGRALRRRISRRAALAAGIGGALVAACSRDHEIRTSPEPNKVGGTARYPLYGAGGEGDPVTLDPFQSPSYLVQVPAAHHYSRLLRFQSGPDISPVDYTRLEGDLAARLPEQPDDVTYVFTLKPNITFHDKPPLHGRPATARDFVLAWEAFKSRSTLASLFSDVVNRVEAPDAGTVTFTLKEPYAPFLTRHAAAQAGIWLIPVETIGNGQAAEDPVGTGPWVFRQWDHGVAIRWERNPAYFDNPLPYFAGVEGSIAGDPQRLLVALQVGDLDFASLGGNYEESHKKLDPRGSEQFLPTGSLTGFYFNFDIQPWADTRVRRALSLALDREGYLKVQDQTKKGNWHSFLPPALAPYYLSPRDDRAEFGPNAALFQRDIAEAKKLLAAAGFENELSFRLTANVDRYGPQAKQAWELFAATIAEAGFRAELT